MEDQGETKVQRMRLHKSEYYYGSTQLEHAGDAGRVEGAVGDADMEPESPLVKLLRRDPFGGDVLMIEERRARRYGHHGVVPEEVVLIPVESGKKRKRKAEVLTSNTRFKVGGVAPLGPKAREEYERWAAPRKRRLKARGFGVRMPGFGVGTVETGDIEGGGIPEITTVPKPVAVAVAVVPEVVVTAPTPPLAVEEMLKPEGGEQGHMAGEGKVGVRKHPGASSGVSSVCGRGRGKLGVVKSRRVGKPVTISGGRRSVTKDYPARGVGRQLNALNGVVQLVSATVGGVLVNGANRVAGVRLSMFQFLSQLALILMFVNRCSCGEWQGIGWWAARTGVGSPLRRRRCCPCGSTWTWSCEGERGCRSFSWGRRGGVKVCGF